MFQMVQLLEILADESLVCHNNNCNSNNNKTLYVQSFSSITFFTQMRLVHLPANPVLSTIYLVFM